MSGGRKTEYEFDGEMVDGYRVGEFMAVRQRDDRRWHLEHLPTGKSIVYGQYQKTMLQLANALPVEKQQLWLETADICEVCDNLRRYCKEWLALVDAQKEATGHHGHKEVTRLLSFPRIVSQ